MNDADDASFFNVRCAIYARQSVVREGDGDPALASCAIQRAKCAEFIRSRPGAAGTPSRIGSRTSASAVPRRSGPA